MRYAMIETGTVVNIIWLHPDNAGDFPGAIAIEDERPVAIGDTYTGGRYYRNGAEVLTPPEAMRAELATANDQLCDLALQLVDLQIAMDEGVSA